MHYRYHIDFLDFQTHMTDWRGRGIRKQGFKAVNEIDIKCSFVYRVFLLHSEAISSRAGERWGILAEPVPLCFWKRLTTVFCFLQQC